MNIPSLVPGRRSSVLLDCIAIGSSFIMLRLSVKVEASGDCWVFTGFRGSDGYPRLSLGFGRQKRSVLAHRVVYEMLREPIPADLQLDHLCRNRACINPAHLEPVTSRVNTLRGVSPSALNAAKTHCKRGHRFDEKNTRLRPGGVRACRECERYRRRRRSLLKSVRHDGSALADVPRGEPPVSIVTVQAAALVGMTVANQTNARQDGAGNRVDLPGPAEHALRVIPPVRLSIETAPGVEG